MSTLLENADPKGVVCGRFGKQRLAADERVVSPDRSAAMRSHSRDSSARPLAIMDRDGDSPRFNIN
jgi:hypothetical protein